MELQLDRLFDGPPAGYTAKAQAASLGAVPEPLSFRHFSHDMLQVCITNPVAGSCLQRHRLSRLLPNCQLPL